MSKKYANERREFKAEGIKSLVCVPIYKGDAVAGFIGFDSVRNEKTWREDDINLLRIVGEIISNALLRKESEEEIKESYTKLEETLNGTINALSNIVEMKDPYTAGH